MLLEHRSPAAPTLAILALITTAGCAPGEGDIELRSGAVLNEADPIPGGGPCKRCVRGFRQVGAALELCVDTSVRYVTDARDKGTPLLELLTSDTAKWTLIEDSKSTALQQGADIGLAKLGKSAGQYVVARLPIPDGWDDPTELDLVLTGYAGRTHGNDLAEMPRISMTQGGPSSWPCALDFKPPVQAPAFLQAAAPSFVAQLAYPWPGGGVRSCSGVLVSPHQILTAAHCFDADSLAADFNFNSRIDVRFGLAPWLAGGSVVDVTLHEDYKLSGLEADLAIVELASDVDPSIEPAQLAGLQSGVSIGDYWAHGYGVRPYIDTTGYDWGTLKTVTGLKYAATLPGAEPLMNHLLVSKAEKHVPICQGDSGGPLMIMVNGEPRVVGILAARIVRDEERGLDGFEPIGGAIAFNHGHGCGQTDIAHGFAATPFDTDTLVWIHAEIGV